jgi:phosphate transport system ATP-binding protein
VADYTGFFLPGRLIEFDTTAAIFENPSKKETQDYVGVPFRVPRSAAV